MARRGSTRCHIRPRRSGAPPRAKLASGELHEPPCFQQPLRPVQCAPLAASPTLAHSSPTPPHQHTQTHTQAQPVVLCGRQAPRAQRAGGGREGGGARLRGGTQPTLSECGCGSSSLPTLKGSPSETVHTRHTQTGGPPAPAAGNTRPPAPPRSTPRERKPRGGCLTPHHLHKGGGARTAPLGSPSAAGARLPPHRTGSEPVARALLVLLLLAQRSSQHQQHLPPPLAPSPGHTPA